MKSRTQIESKIRCPICRKTIFDGEYLRAPITNFKQGVAHAKCSVCKAWVIIPQIEMTN